jgi:phytoene desaturase
MYSNSEHGSNVETKKALVIGAGIGGLAAACLLARDGYNVEIFEKNDKVGGKLNQFETNGFRFDTGPSLLTMPHVLEQLFDYCGEKMSDYLELLPLNPICRYNYPNGVVFDAFDDIPKTVEQVSRFSREDAAKYASFLDYSRELYERTADVFLYHPLQEWRDLLQMPLTDAFKIDAFTTVAKRLDGVFESAEMRQFFKRFTTYNGSSPYLAPATLNIIPFVELVQGGFYVRGGLYKIADALVALCEKLGVEIRINAPVDSISLLGDVARGIRSNGEYHLGDIIVSNSDAYETKLKLLPDKILSPRKKRRIKNTEPSCSGFVLMLGCDRNWDTLVHHNIFFSKDYEREFEDIFAQRILPKDPTIYIANTSYSDENHAPDGGSNLFILVNAPYLDDGQDWENLKETYTEFLIDELEKRGLIGLKASILVKEVITPSEFYEKYRSNKGSIYGTSSNSMFSAFLRPRNRMKEVENLLLVGGSTHPGGGIPLCVLSAFHACGVKVGDAT